VDLVCRQGLVDHSDLVALSSLVGLACPVDLAARLVQARPITVYKLFICSILLTGLPGVPLLPRSPGGPGGHFLH
jgi:hypothetical protein